MHLQKCTDTARSCIFYFEVGMAIQDWKNKLPVNKRGSLLKKPGRPLRRLALLISAFAVVLALGLSWFWSQEPDLMTVANTSDSPVVGALTTITLVNVGETLLNKPGGYLSNDIFPPSLWLDNIPQWEYGVIIQIRDLSKALREAFSRSQSQSKEDKDLSLAEPRLNFDHANWIMPRTEAEYSKGLEYLRSYHTRLHDADQQDAQFFARADNLNYWLGTVQSRLGSLSQRLGASVGQKRINTDLAGDAQTETEATQSSPSPDEFEIKTSWFEIDDVFYEARGTTWALVHFLKAAEVDFEDVLLKKNAQISLRQIIRELEATQTPLFSPMILNGSGFGILPNHSLTLASYISRANAAIIDLRELLDRG
ncbi:MAG: DUF2333 family protein [Porticoccaceae bacterium]